MILCRHHISDRMNPMERKRVLICSKVDPAGSSIADHLLKNYEFKPSQKYEGSYEYRDFLLRFIEQRHLDYSGMAGDLSTDGIEPVDVVFLSKHSSAAGIKSLTVHATGNFGVAELGGRDGTVSMSDPSHMTSSLRILASEPIDRFSVTFEATHHGPYAEIPNYFIEIGTTEDEWKDRSALSIVSKAIVESRSNRDETFVGVGGGHYSPKITEYALNNKCNIGHIISKHAHNYLKKELLMKTFEFTPQCRGFIMDSKGSRGAVRQMVKEAVNENSLELILL